MPKFKFTAKGLEAKLREPHAKRVDYFDTSTPGLCLTIGPRAATWFYFRRIDGKLTRLTLGSHVDLDREGAGRTPPAAGFSVARERQSAVEDQIAKGLHPKAEQAREKAAARESRTADLARIVRTVAGEWSGRHFPTLSDSTRRDYQRALDAFVGKFGEDDIGALRRGALLRYLDTIPGLNANVAATVIRQLFAYARDRYELENNPAAELKNPAKPAKRKRTLDRAEIRVLWKACELAGYPYGHALRFALCTGQRIGEVGALRRNEVDAGYWIQSDNKADRRIDLFLAQHAAAILADCPNLGKAAPYFSASTDEDGTPRALRSDVWSNAITRHVAPQIEPAARALRLDPIAKDWTPHDLRRTVRTALTGWCSVSPDTAERVLNHALSGLRGVYDHADYRPHVADALQRWDAELTRILAGEAPAVVSFAEHKTAKRKRA